MILNIVIFCLISILLSSGAEFPQYLKKCSLSDPALNDCLKEQGNKMIPNVLNGDVNLGIPDKNRLKIPKVLIQPNNKFEIEVDNCDGIGFNTFKLVDIKINKKFQTIKFIGLLEEFWWECTYKAHGELLGKRFNDKGFANITSTNSLESYSADYYFEEINGTSYYQVNNDIFQIKNTTILFHLIPTEGNDMQVNELNKILNENVDYFTRRFLPKVETLSAGIVTEFINQIFGAIPASQLFDP